MNIFSALSVPTTTIDHSLLAICQGVSPKDTALQWAASKVQRCVCVCVCVCALAYMCECVSTNPETMSTKHSVSPEPSIYTKSTMSTEHSVSVELSALTKPTCRAFCVLQAFSIH